MIQNFTVDLESLTEHRLLLDNPSSSNAPHEYTQVIDLKTKVTRGFGFIQFTTPEMVDFAVQQGLHYEMNSKKVTVKRAQAHHPSPCMPDVAGDLMGLQQGSVPVAVYQELLAMGGY